MNDSRAKMLTLLHGKSSPKRILVRTAAGPDIGFGHLRRTLILARKLRRSTHPCFLLDPGDGWSQDQVRSDGFEYRYFDSCKPWSGLETADALLVDTRQRAGLNRLVAEARIRGIPVASIHDLGLAPLASDVVIDGSMLPSVARFPRVDTTFFVGTDYLVLGDACSRFHRTNKTIRPRIGKVVINLGGGNGGRFFRSTLSGLRAAQLPLEVVGLPGFCSWGQGKIASASWGPLRFRWLSPEEDAVTLMFDADLVISAGGLSAYEALCVGTPLCALSFDRYQAATIGAIAHAGACLNLGLGAYLRSDKVRRRFIELNENQELRRRLSTCGRRLVDGGGRLRVARILLSLIERKFLGKANGC
jgi:spore coat polysaccharide biosynthesis predicted glycosyltransferase SpsG